MILISYYIWIVLSIKRPIIGDMIGSTEETYILHYEFERQNWTFLLFLLVQRNSFLHSF